MNTDAPDAELFPAHSLDAATVVCVCVCVRVSEYVYTSLFICKYMGHIQNTCMYTDAPDAELFSAHSLDAATVVCVCMCACVSV